MKTRFAVLLSLAACICALLNVSPSAAAPGTGKWTSKASLPTLRTFFAAATLNGSLYTVGGNTPSNILSSVVEVYHPSTDTWSTAASFPFPIQRASAAVVNGKLYVIGGCQDLACGNFLNTVYVYDPLANTWSLKSPMSTPRRDGNFLAVLNGIIYAVGGGQGPGACTATSAVEAYDPLADSWTPLAPTLVAHWLAAVVALNGKIYVAGGATCKAGAFTTIANAEVYDPSTKAWTPVASMPFAENSGEGAVLNGRLYVVDGNALGFCDPCTQVYDPGTDSWGLDTPDPTGRFTPWGDVVDGSLYVIGGVSLSGTLLSTNEAFTPSVPFASFSAKVDINLSTSSFDVNSSFTLASGSSIDPLTQNVTFQLGGFSTTIPAGSFIQGPDGKFLFSGFINGVAIEVNITPLGGGSYAFMIEGTGASNLPTSNPVTVGLTIGMNTGSTSVNAGFQ